LTQHHLSSQATGTSKNREAAIRVGAQLESYIRKPVEVGICSIELEEQQLPPIGKRRTNPVSWWGRQQFGVADLAKVAGKILCLPAAAAGGERCWSAFGQVWTTKRASLLVGRVALLAYIYYNKRVLDHDMLGGASTKDRNWGGGGWEEWEAYLAALPSYSFDGHGRAVETVEAVEEVMELE
jgi:hypothetical protein